MALYRILCNLGIVFEQELQELLLVVDTVVFVSYVEELELVRVHTVLGLQQHVLLLNDDMISN